MHFHISSTWSFSSGHPASKEHFALQQSLVVWPGFPALAVPSQVLDMPGILMAHHWEKSCSCTGQAELSATSGATQVLCHYLSSSSLKHGLRPAVVAKFKLFFTAERSSVAEFFLCSDGLCEEGAGGRVGRCLVQPAPAALLFMWSVCSWSEGGHPGVTAADVLSVSCQRIPLPHKVHCQDQGILWNSTFARVAWGMKPEQWAKHGIFLLKQIPPGQTHTMDLLIMDLRAWDSFVAFTSHWC